MADFDLNTGPDLPEKTDFGIGCIGAGFIMREASPIASNCAAVIGLGFEIMPIAPSGPCSRRTHLTTRPIRADIGRGHHKDRFGTSD